MDLRRVKRRLAILAIVCAAWGCAARNEVIDTGSGPVDRRGRPVDHVDDRGTGDAAWETESPAEAIEEESIEDAVEDSER
jgi:hypothetical protein